MSQYMKCRSDDILLDIKSYWYGKWYVNKYIVIYANNIVLLYHYNYYIIHNFFYYIVKTNVTTIRITAV